MLMLSLIHILAEAVCERIMVIDETEKSLSMIDERLETAIKQTCLLYTSRCV